MSTEIERKFLVVSNAWRKLAQGERYVQGYLSSVPDRTVRVRLSGETCTLTIKGRSAGISRQEFEYNIPIADAEPLLALCERPLIEKTRYRIPHAGRIWEVDEFAGVNAGLVIAEVELESEHAAIDLPAWVGAEVSHDARYFNSNLVSKPYTTW